MSGKRKIITLLCLILTVVLASCSMLRSSTSEKEEGDKKKNPPKALTRMEKDTDGIVRDLEEVRQMRARQIREAKSPSKQSQPDKELEKQGQDQKQPADGKEEKQQENEEKNQKQQGEQEQNKQEEDQGKQEEKQGGEQAAQLMPTAQPVPQPDWNKLESTVEGLNELWNSYEPLARSDGAMPETIKGFDDQLMALTEQIMARNEEKTLLAANTLYLYYPDFLKLYSHNQPPEVKQIKGLTRQILTYGQQDRWEDTKPLLDQMKKAWQEAKTKMKKPDKLLNSQIDAAISDFRFVVSEKKINLADIKGRILIKNLDKVE